MNPIKPLSDEDRLTPVHYAAIRADGLTFMQCLWATLEYPELVAQVDRLFGTRIISRSMPIEKMIDAATGKQDADIQTFLRFVWNYIFCRTPKIS